MPTIVELPGQVEVEFPDGIDPGTITNTVLPIINRYGQFQVGGPLKGHAGALDKVYDFMPWRSFDRFMEAAKVETKPDLMGGIKASIKDPYGVALEATDLLGLGLDVGDVARVGKRVLPPIAARVEDALNQPISPMFNQQGAITFHGSPHKFDKFKHEFMGSGEGAQAYGWGTYLRDSSVNTGSSRGHPVVSC